MSANSWLPGRAGGALKVVAISRRDGGETRASAVGLRRAPAWPMPQAMVIGIVHHLVQIATVVGFAFAFWLRGRVASRAAR